MEAGLLELAIKELASQGPYALVLGGIAFCFVKFWMLPKAVADVEKTKAEAMANLELASAFKTVASAVDSLSETHSSHRHEARQAISCLADVYESIMAGDVVRARAQLQVVSTMFKS